MKLDIVAWGNDIGGLSLQSDKGDGSILARAFTYSEPVTYRGPRVLEIHQTGSAQVTETPATSTPEDEAHQSIPLPPEELPATGEGEATPIPEELAKRREDKPTLVALAALPTNSRRATILLAPAAEGCFRAYVIDDDPSKLPTGSLRVHNLAPLPIALQFPDGKTREMASGKTLLIDAPQGYLSYRLAYKNEGEWTVQENNMIPVPEDRQTQMIILRSDNQFFLSSDGTRGGFLQSVTLSRQPEP